MTTRKKKYAGRPLELGPLLASLDPNKLYSPAMISSLRVDRNENRKEHLRIRRNLASFARRHYLPKNGDDVIVHERRTVPAWFGSTWQEPLTEDDVAPLEVREPTKKVEKKPVVRKSTGKSRRAGPGRRMVYGKLIHNLDIHSLYDPIAIVHAGERWLDEEGFTELQLANRKHRAGNSLDQFRRRHLPKEADGFIQREESRNKAVPAWYGWRWLLALPDYELAPEKKDAIRAQLEREPTPSELTGIAVINSSLSVKSSEARTTHPLSTQQTQTELSTMTPVQTMNRKQNPLQRVQSRLARGANWASEVLMRIPKVRFALPVFFFMVVGSVSAVYVPSVRVGYDLLTSEGPNAAFRYFRTIMKGDRDDHSLYGYAWSAFRSQELSEAEQAADELLSRPINEGMAANVYYLNGHLGLVSSDFDKARANFEKALVYYQGIDHQENIHNTLMGLAQVEMRDGDLDTADLLLDHAKNIDALNVVWGPFYQMRSRIAFERGDYLSALKHAEKSVDSFADDPNRTAQALSDVGFYLMLLGQYEKGKKVTQRAELHIVRTGDLKKHYYNLINDILYFKCYGLEFQATAQQIHEYAKGTEDDYLLDFLDFALSHQCPSRVGTLDPNAPGPTEPPPRTRRGVPGTRIDHNQH